MDVAPWNFPRSSTQALLVISERRKGNLGFSQTPCIITFPVDIVNRANNYQQKYVNAVNVIGL